MRTIKRSSAHESPIRLLFCYCRVILWDCIFSINWIVLLSPTMSEKPGGETDLQRYMNLSKLYLDLI